MSNWLGGKRSRLQLGSQKTGEDEMKRWKIAGWALAAFLATATLRATAQQDEAPILKPKPKPVTTATLLVTCDLVCNWKLDGEAKGRIEAGGSAKAKVEFGQHEVVGTTEDGMDKVESDMEIKEAGQTSFKVLLLPVRQSRLQTEQQAHERAEREAQERAEEKARDYAAQEERQKELEREAWEQAALVQPTLRNNEGVELSNQKRYKDAAPLLKSACDGGVMAGCTSLGALYEFGKGVSRDYTQARALYQKACDGGDMTGCNNLGFLYYKGHGVYKDLAQARTLWTRACAGDVQAACISLRRTN